MKYDDDKQDVRKICILYLLYKINMPMTNSQLVDFAAETDFMDYFELRSYLTEMTEAGLLDETVIKNQTYYSITEDGESLLLMFRKTKLSEESCNRINFYIGRHKKKIKAETEVTAEWFYDPDSKFIVKCGLYEGNAVIMEVNVSVVDRDVAEHICNKWKGGSSELFEKFFNELSADYCFKDKHREA